MATEFWIAVPSQKRAIWFGKIHANWGPPRTGLAALQAWPATLELACDRPRVLAAWINRHGAEDIRSGNDTDDSDLLFRTDLKEPPYDGSPRAGWIVDDAWDLLDG